MTDWTRAELKAYILLFCANANYSESPEESKLIQSKVGELRYERVHKSFDKDNDYQRIQNIKLNVERLNYSKEEMDQLYAEILEVFFADGEFDNLEQNIYRGLKKVLS